jgi:hypothetical protein
MLAIPALELGLFSMSMSQALTVVQRLQAREVQKVVSVII